MQLMHYLHQQLHVFVVAPFTSQHLCVDVLNKKYKIYLNRLAGPSGQHLVMHALNRIDSDTYTNTHLRALEIRNAQHTHTHILNTPNRGKQTIRVLVIACGLFKCHGLLCARPICERVSNDDIDRRIVDLSIALLYYDNYF